MIDERWFVSKSFGHFGPYWELGIDWQLAIGVRRIRGSWELLVGPFYIWYSPWGI